MRHYEERPGQLVILYAGCCLACFAVAALLLAIFGVRFLSVEMGGIPPLYLKGNLCKQRQDAMRRVKEVSLSGGAVLKRKKPRERESGFYYFQVLYSTTNGDTVLNEKYLEFVRRLEQRIVSRRALAPDGRRYSFTDFCKRRYPDKQMREIRGDLPYDLDAGCESDPIKCCAFPMSTLGLFARRWLPLPSPPPFAMWKRKRTGYFWIDDSSPLWQEAPCMLPPGIKGFGWFKKLLIGVADSFTNDPSSWRDFLCSGNSVRLPSGFSCRCLALAYNSYQLLSSFDMVALGGWDYEADVNLSRHHIDTVVEYWSEYSDDNVLQRRARLQRGVRWGDQGWSNPEGVSTSMEGGEKALWPSAHPFVIGDQVPAYVARAGTARRLCEASTIQRRRWRGSCSCRRRWSNWKEKYLQPGWQCVGDQVTYTGHGIDPTQSMALVPARYPTPFETMIDDGFGQCLEDGEVDGRYVCLRRRDSAKCLQSMFFFGFPLSNLDPAWTSLDPGPEFDRSRKLLMGWIFAAYNEMLEEANKEAEGLGLQVNWDANNVQFGDALIVLYVESMLTGDFVLIFVGIAYVLVYCWYMMASLFLAIMSLLLIVLSFGPAVLLYTLVFQQSYVGALHLNVVFIMLGIGADNVFVILDSFAQAKAEAKAEGLQSDLRFTLSRAVRHSSKACMCTSATTFIAFCANGKSSFPAIRTFGLFSASVVLCNFTANFTLMLAVIAYNERRADDAARRLAAVRHASSGQRSTGLTAAAAPPLSANGRHTAVAARVGGVLKLMGPQASGGGLQVGDAYSLDSAGSLKSGQEAAGDREGEGDLRLVDRFFNRWFFPSVYTCRWLLILLLFADFGFSVYKSLQLEPDPKMPNPFPEKDNYSRVAPMLTANFNRTFLAPLRLKVSLVFGLDYQGPIDRGGVPEHKDCFSDCAGQTPIYKDILGLESSPRERLDIQVELQRRLKVLCDELTALSLKDPGNLTRAEAGLRIMPEGSMRGASSVTCPLTWFERWARVRKAMSDREEKYQYPSLDFCCGTRSEFLEFLAAPCDKDLHTCLPQGTNGESLDQQIFFQSDGPNLKHPVFIVDVFTSQMWEDFYELGIELYHRWDKLMDAFREMPRWFPSETIEAVVVHGRRFALADIFEAVQSSEHFPAASVRLGGVVLRAGTPIVLEVTETGAGLVSVACTFQRLLLPWQRDPLGLRGPPAKAGLPAQKLGDEEDEAAGAVLWEVSAGAHPVAVSAFATDYYAFHYFFTQEKMIDEMYGGISASMFLAFLVLLISTQNVIVAFLAIVCISDTVASALALGVFCGWKIGLIEAIVYVMVIGLAVDYVVHLADAYLESPAESRKERARFMLTKMGGAILSGALTSLGVSVFMMMCYSLFLVKFGIMIFWVVIKSVVISLVFYTALLATLGPEGDCCTLRWCSSCSLFASKEDPLAAATAAAPRPSRASRPPPVGPSLSEASAASGGRASPAAPAAPPPPPFPEHPPWSSVDSSAAFVGGVAADDFGIGGGGGGGGLAWRPTHWSHQLQPEHQPSPWFLQHAAPSGGLAGQSSATTGMEMRRFF